ncbi:MAG TPA: EAL domain-containing protein [Rhodanobacteraceae bacterium]
MTRGPFRTRLRRGLGAWWTGVLLLVTGLACAAPATPAPAAATTAPATWTAYQRNFYFQHLNGRNGLAQNTVSLVFQDHTGFMWFVTQGGLFRYDGYRVTRFTHDPDDARSLPDNSVITAIADAGDGWLWLGSTNAGLVLFDPASGHTAPLPAAIARRGTKIDSLLNLADGSVLVATTHGIDQLTGARAHPVLTPVWAAPANPPAEGKTRLTRCADGKVFASAGSTVLGIDTARHAARVLAHAPAPAVMLDCDPHSGLQWATADGLFAFNAQTHALTRTWQPAAGTSIVAGTIDADGRTWLGESNHNLVRLNAGGTPTTIEAAPLGISGGLPDASIETLYVDRTDLLWVGTVTAGVAWTHVHRGPIQAVLNVAGNLRERTNIRGFWPAPGGDLWVATAGPGLVRYSPTTHGVTSYASALQQAVGAPATPQALKPDRPLPYFTSATAGVRVLGFTPGANGTVWLPTNRGILVLDPATGAITRAPLADPSARQATTALLRARNGDLWAAPLDAGLVHYHAGKVVQRFTQAQGLANNLVVSLAETPNGTLFAGTLNGLSAITPATGKVQSFREIPGDPHSLAGFTIASLLVDHAGQLWAGSISGLSRLVSLGPRGARFQRYGAKNGLPDDTIDCLLQGADQQIWFSTNLGIGRLDPTSGAVRTFGMADGTQGNEYNSGACRKLANGNLLFGGHGFDVIDPAKIHAAGPAAPITFTLIDAGGGQLPIPTRADSSVTLKPRDRSVYVAFSTLDYAASGHNRYRTRLLGSRHPAWSVPSVEHTVAYTGLTPGRYVLEVQSVLRDGSLGRTAALHLDITEAWWWTLPMRIVYALAVALLVLVIALGWRGHHLEQVRYRRQLRLREARLREALWGSGDEFFDWNLEQGTILRLGPEGAPGGHREESIAADEWRQTMVHPDDLANLDHALAEHLAGRSEHFEVELRVRGQAAEWTWVISRGRIVERDDAGKPLRVCGTERDISAIRTADRERRIASEVIRNMSEAVTVTDLSYRFLSVNTAFTRMTGYAEAEVIGRDASILNGSRHAPGNYDQLRQTLAETGHWRGELWQRRKDGEEFLCWVELNEVRDASGQRTHMIGVLTDITDRKRAEQELRYLANYDTLTGLPNRALLGERLGAAVISARRTGHKVGLLFLDLDRFKHINDSLGHTAGDHTLKAAGARLRQCVRENDVVARLGGDEFTVVLENLVDLRGAEDMAQRLIQAFVRPLMITSSQEAVISPSIGIALYPDHGQTPADLLKCADTAMYQAKERGRNTWAVYHAGMDAQARGHATMVTALRRALERNELSMTYQPKLALRDGTVTGMEALLRWHSPELGEIPPSVFIPLAEETGQIHDISAYVFSTACADLRRFRDSGHANLTMAINLSAAQLNRPDLTLHICDMLAEHDVAPNQVELELTETMVMANAEQSVRLLGELKSIGARLAIDDFGTGYSSLAYLKRLPIDTLKIDQTFVRDITTDPDDAAITSTIITMAHSLQIRVVAEGVETHAQLEFLREHQCDEIQGYWLSRPLTADACLAFLDQHATIRIEPA